MRKELMLLLTGCWLIVCAAYAQEPDPVTSSESAPQIVYLTQDQVQQEVRDILRKEYAIYPNMTRTEMVHLRATQILGGYVPRSSSMTFWKDFHAMPKEAQQALETEALGVAKYMAQKHIVFGQGRE